MPSDEPNMKKKDFFPGKSQPMTVRTHPVKSHGLSVHYTCLPPHFFPLYKRALLSISEGHLRVRLTMVAYCDLQLTVSTK